MIAVGTTGPASAESNVTVPVIAKTERQLTLTELETQESHRQAARRAVRLGTSPEKPNGAAAGIPLSSNKAVETGVTAAVTTELAIPDRSGVTGPVTAPVANANSAAAAQRQGPNGSQPQKCRTSTPACDHGVALGFYNFVRPNACVLGFTLGRHIATGEEFQALVNEADHKHEHLFFNVATVKPTWKTGTTATKEQILECPYLWGDCDPKKYIGDDPAEAAKHYLNESLEVRTAIKTGLDGLGFAPCAIWRSGVGWQFLIRLDQAIHPEEAETLVGKLHTALGFDPVVRNCNRILRVPGSVNWKNAKYGRVPAGCVPLSLSKAVTNIDDVRKALAGVPEPEKNEHPGGAADIKIDWTKVQSTGGWLQSVDDLPARATVKLKTIVGHSGSLDELNDQLIGAKLLEKEYGSWSEVTLAFAAALQASGSYAPEQIAEALLANLPCNQHVANQKDKERTIERAISRSHRPTQVAGAGVRFRDRNRYGDPKPSLANAVIAIRALGINASYNLFHHRINVTYNGNAQTIREGLLTDDTVSAARSLINNTYRIDCGDANTLAAIREIASDNAYDPVLDMLDDCQGKWDGVKRLGTWVIIYLGCEDTPFNRAIGRLVLIAACRRARSPGCKFDFITVLEGPEGIDKSTAIRVVAGDENFSDQSIIGASDKEVQEQLDGVWMHENADLAGMKRAEVEHVKAFASRQVDRARPAYGRVREDRPRRSIEWGTTNNKEYLLSQTGNRRFWPLETAKIDIDALKRDREQLLGEASTYEAAGESIALDPSLWGDAREAQEQRRVADPWEDLLNFMSALVVHKSGDGHERVASADVLFHVLQIPRAQQTSGHAQRLANAMEHAGWKRNQSGRVMIDGKPVRGYIRPAYGPTGVASATGAQGVAVAGCMTGPTGPANQVGPSPQMPTGIVSATAQAQADLTLGEPRVAGST